MACWTRIALDTSGGRIGRTYSGRVGICRACRLGRSPGLHELLGYYCGGSSQ